jgi:hypothetical protein
MSDRGLTCSRRAFLRGAVAAGLVVFIPSGHGRPAIAVPTGRESPVFLDERELETLRAAVDRFVPGQPEDPDPGAVAARCAEAIDALLGAFSVDPPLIFAGAPFSDRGGHHTNHFEEFLPLDDYETVSWRLRIEGSRNRSALEFNGPVRGYQEIYRDGLAALDDAAPGDARFADLPAPARDLILRDSGDDDIEALVDIAVPHTLEFMYGAPEYGGNEDLVGWDFTDWMGDVQPRGWTRQEVENPDRSGTPEASPDVPVPVPLEELAPLAAPEYGHGLRARSGGSLDAWRAEVGAVLDARSRIEQALEGVGGRPGAASALEGRDGG